MLLSSFLFKFLFQVKLITDFGYHPLIAIAEEIKQYKLINRSTNDKIEKNVFFNALHISINPIDIKNVLSAIAITNSILLPPYNKYSINIIAKVIPIKNISDLMDCL